MCISTLIIFVNLVTFSVSRCLLAVLLIKFERRLVLLHLVRMTLLEPDCRLRAFEAWLDSTLDVYSAAVIL